MSTYVFTLLLFYCFFDITFFGFWQPRGWISTNKHDDDDNDDDIWPRCGLQSTNNGIPQAIN